MGADYLKLLREIGIIFSIFLFSEFLNKATGIPIPSSIIGMMILLACLVIGIIKIEMIENISNFLLGHLTFLFVPAGVGVMKNFNLIKDEWVYMLIVLIISTILVMGVTGSTVQFLKRRLSK